MTSEQFTFKAILVLYKWLHVLLMHKPSNKILKVGGYAKSAWCCLLIFYCSGISKIKPWFKLQQVFKWSRLKSSFLYHKSNSDLVSAIMCVLVCKVCLCMCACLAKVWHFTCMALSANISLCCSLCYFGIVLNSILLYPSRLAQPYVCIDFNLHLQYIQTVSHFLFARPICLLLSDCVRCSTWLCPNTNT